MSTELKDLADLARDFFVKEVAPRHDEFVAQGYPDKAVYRRAGELGLFASTAAFNCMAATATWRSTPSP